MFNDAVSASLFALSALHVTLSLIFSGAKLVLRHNLHFFRFVRKIAKSGF